MLGPLANSLGGFCSTIARESSKREARRAKRKAAKSEEQSRKRLRAKTKAQSPKDQEDPSIHLLPFSSCLFALGSLPFCSFRAKLRANNCEFGIRIQIRRRNFAARNLSY